ncbi:MULTISPECIES: lipoprotein [Erwinia]|uniref:LPS translocon maturation chaperone LptM n=1 Tax=Erwinia TaxID=551 RepID=UPI000550EB71|nr:MULTISPECIES: lipoprotein [Erwinia]
MNKMICRMALVLAAASLTGCGLKGPLYFPPDDRPKQQTAPDAAQTVKPSQSDEQQTPTTR